MESEFLLNLKEISLQVIIISMIVFGLTMLIKWPIKKATAKLDENKRKAVNTIIVFIPILLSFILNILYFGLMQNNWFGLQVFESAGSSYILAVAIYAIYSRFVIIIKGIKGKTDSNEDFSKQTVAFIKNNMKTLSQTLKVDEDKLSQVVSKIESLLAIKQEIINNALLQDISATEKLDDELKQLRSEELLLKQSIENANEEFVAYQNSLKKKGV